MKKDISEAELRRRVQETFDRIERAFEGIDPDLAECEQAMGALTLTFSDGSRCILSTQPSVRQLWLALAARGTAHHFDWTERGWLDDKGKGIELLSFLEGYVREAIGTHSRVEFCIKGE